MGWYYQNMLRPWLFRYNEEKAHEYAVMLMKTMSGLPILCKTMERAQLPPRTEPIELFGLRFPNTVGLAAGMDKNAEIWRACSAFGFGHVEIGTITAEKQPGNPRPRMFRYPEQTAVINRMGFNNDGAEIIAKRLKDARAHTKRRTPLGINIGKSKTTPIDQAAGDYLKSFNLLADYADYVTVNVSSPNTPDLRMLQHDEYLDTLLSTLQEANLSRAKKLGVKPIPLLLKIAPDLTYREIDGMLESLMRHRFSGIIATNTTISRPGAMATATESGGLSGKPLHELSCKIINYIHRTTEGKLPIIGSGGIIDARSAGETMDAGASLIQIYTGWIFQGPFLPAELAKALAPRQREWV